MGVPGTGTGTVLRPYQAEAVAAITAGLRRGSRGQLHAACGTGKTRIAAEAVARLVPAGVIVVLVPSIALAAQTLSAWPAGCPVDAALAVCSDQSAGGGARLSGLAVPVSTDAGAIAKWLADPAGRVLAVATYDSAHRLDEALRRAGQRAAVVVCDEAHRTAGRAGKMTAAVLGEGFLPGRRLYMTATPRIGTGVRAGGEIAVTSMDDESVYGPVLYDYPFGRAIAEGWLKDYRLVVAATADDHVRGLAGGGACLAGDGVPVRMAAAQAALAMAAAARGLRRCVAFLPRVADAQLFARTLPRTLALLPPDRRPAGPVSAGFVHGGMTGLQRDLVLERLRNPPADGWAVVANARCLGEGIDIPEIDSVLFAAPKESVTDIAQAIGRALRPHGDADTATVIVPALLPPGGDGLPETADGSPWEPVLNVVRALAAHDEALTAGLGRARASRAARAGHPRGQELPAKIIVQAPPGTVWRALEALRIQIVDGTTASWWDGYGQARAYHAASGHIDAPLRHVTGTGFALGQWLTRQRTSRSRGRLPASRIHALDGLGMTWDVPDAAWMRAYQDARAFAGQHGHLNVPAGRKTADGTSLAGWLQTQRTARHADQITPERIALLDAIGFCWNPARDRWMRRYRDLTTALAASGGQLPAGTDAARWVNSQRKAHQAGTLDQRKTALLEQAGIQLSPPGIWASRYQALLAFKAGHGHTRVPAGYRTADGIPLGGWVNGQRDSHAKGTLPADRIRLLNEAGFCWNTREEHWQARYRQARDWATRHGNLNLPRGALRNWLQNQQRRHREGRLPEKHARLLAALGALSEPAPPATDRKNPPGPTTGTP